jgi:hypothetical protein
MDCVVSEPLPNTLLNMNIKFFFELLFKYVQIVHPEDVLDASLRVMGSLTNDIT